MESKTFWIAWGNTDTTEGRGNSYPICISECRATAIRCGAKQGVMGCDCEVTLYQSTQINGYWVAPFYHTNPTQEDLKADKSHQERLEALKKCRDAGVDEKTIQVLTEGFQRLKEDK